MIFDKEYANQMLDRLIDRIYNSNKYRLNKFLSDGESIAEEKEIVIDKLWDTVLSKAGGFRNGIGDLTVQKALDSIRKKGANITYSIGNSGNHIVHLGKMEYELIQGNGFIEANLCFTHYHPGKKFMRWITMDADAFADFLLGFDEFLSDVEEKLKNLALELKKRVMVLTVLEETINAHKSNASCTKGIGFISVSKFEPNGKVLATLMDSRTHKYIGEYIDINSLDESLMNIYRNHSL